MPDVDLRRLPRRARYAIGIAVALVVGGIAWLVGRDEPTPGWVVAGIRVLGTVVAVLVVVWLVWRVTRRRP